ncbi:Conjugal transfer protein TraI [Chitinophaga sp. 180180018-3]
MKKCIWLSVIVCLFTIMPTKRSHAIVWVVVKAAAKKIIKAIDLQVQRLQNKTIGLQNAQRAVENTLSKLKLNEIGDWMDKQREQYAKYYDELQKVRNTIAYYRRVKAIIQRQIDLVDEYKRAYALFKRDKNFTPQEIEQMGFIYQGIFDESMKNIDELLLVVNALSTRMSDAKRLELISAAGERVDRNFSHLLEFNRNNALLSMQRAKDQTEVMGLKALYGIK